MDDLQLALARMKALQDQMRKQQGLGRPIISAFFQGYRFVAVGSKLFYSKDWQTFHDFLLHYIGHLFSKEWFAQQSKKTGASRHPLLIWHDALRQFQQRNEKPGAKIQSAPMTGAAAAFLGLSYNLYLLAHNAGLQERLIRRLRHIEQFYGANYETYVAAAFIKAGFQLRIEDEAKAETTHVEFDAFYPPTQQWFSVEAKARAANKVDPNVGNQLYEALAKQATHKRVVFIEMSMPDRHDGARNVEFMERAVDSMRGKDATLTIKGSPAPEAYVFITNHPYHFLLEDEDFRVAVYSTGFKISDFGIDAQFRNLHLALEARERHVEMFGLMDSLREHFEIPSTFEGEIPDFDMESELPRLFIGNTYLVPNDKGEEVAGILESATVSPQERAAWGVYHLADGKRIIASTPLTDGELRAYARYPDTFFGVFNKQGGKVETVVEMYDFLFQSYGKSSREKLLEFLKDYPDQASIQSMTQPQLARFYCELMAESTFRRPPG